MAADMLTQAYYGNTIQQWITAFAIVLGAVIVGKFVYWIFKRVVKRATAKTKTKVDDLIVDMIEKPVALVIILLGIWLAFQALNVSESVSAWINNGFQFVIVLTIAWIATRLIDAVLKEYVSPMVSKSKTDLDDMILPILRKGSKVIIWVMAIIVALNNAGYNVGALLAGLGIGGLAFALAAKDTISNIFGGFTIVTDKPFRLNDRVQVNGYDGFVKEIGLRSTRLETLNGRMVIIPNMKFTENAVENVSAEPSRKVVLNLGVTYETTPEKIEEAIEILKDIIKKDDSTEEKVLASFNEYRDFSLNILFIYWIRKESDILQTQSQISLEILRRFNSAGIEFAYPTHTIINKK